MKIEALQADERKDTPALRKARGAFFTPPEITKFITEWAVRNSDNIVLEPSCGEASFLLEAGKRLKNLGALKLFWTDQLHGVEVHSASADCARALLTTHSLDAQIRVSDFFDISSSPNYDAVIGNPPYIRYQDFAGEARAKGLQAALAQGVRAIMIFFHSLEHEQKNLSFARKNYYRSRRQGPVILRDLNFQLLPGKGSVTRGVGKHDKQVQLSEIFDRLITLVAERNPDFYECVDGKLIKSTG